MLSASGEEGTGPPVWLGKVVQDFDSQEQEQEQEPEVKMAWYGSLNADGSLATELTRSWVPLCRGIAKSGCYHR